MINIPPIKPGTEIKTERLPDISQIWKPGQILNATVETGSETLDRILLRIGHQLIEARTPVPLKTGDQIRLLVKATGSLPLLAIQTRPDTAAVAADRLRHVIAQQSNPVQMLDTIQRIINNTEIAPTLKQPLQQFLHQLPDITQVLQPEQVSRLIKNSGVFLESRMLAGPTPTPDIGSDIKGQLLKLDAVLQRELPPSPINRGDIRQLQNIVQDFTRGDTSLQQLVRSLATLLPRDSLQQVLNFFSGNKPAAVPEELLPVLTQLMVNIKHQPRARQLTETLVKLLQANQALQDLKTAVEQTLARITSQQLIPLTREADNPLLLLFGLIFRDKDTSYLVDFRIEQEQKARDGQQEQWSVTLNFNFPELGPIQSRLHLIGNQLTTRFHAEQAATVRKIEQHLPLLQSALQKAGLQVTRIDVVQQAIQTPRDIPADIHILDDKA